MHLPVFVPTLLSLTLLAHAQDRTQTQNKNFYSAAKEYALGAQLADQVRRHSIPLGLPAVENYAANVGLRLATQMPNSHESWSFSVIRGRKLGPANEPISLPGGFIFVPAELLLACHNEAEFAGMLAHAVAHVTERHMTRQAPGEISNLAAIPLIFMGSPDENQFAPIARLQMKRQFELEADQIAVKLLNSAGFDPASLRSYIERTQIPQTATNLSPLLPVSLRLSNLDQALQNQPTNGPYIVSTDLFQSMQADVRR